MSTPTAYGKQLAKQAPPITQEQAEAAARVLCADDTEAPERSTA